MVSSSSRREADRSARPKRLSKKNAWQHVTAFALLASSAALLMMTTPGSHSVHADKKAPLEPLRRATFYVDLTETLDGEETSFNITKELIDRTLILHGYRPVKKKKRASAELLISGKCIAKFEGKTDFGYGKARFHLEHKYKATVNVTVKEQAKTPATPQDSANTAKPSQPAKQSTHEASYENGRIEKEAAEKDIRRIAGTELGRQIMRESFLADQETCGLLKALEAKGSGQKFTAIIKKLVERGVAAVPYLLEALGNDAPVHLPGKYPGLDSRTRERFRVLHVADMALAKILREPRVFTINTPPHTMFDGVLYWTWKWEDLQGIPKRHRLRPDLREKLEQPKKEAKK